MTLAPSLCSQRYTGYHTSKLVSTVKRSTSCSIQNADAKGVQ